MSPLREGMCIYQKIVMYASQMTVLRSEGTEQLGEGNKKFHPINFIMSMKLYNDVFQEISIMGWWFISIIR